MTYDPQIGRVPLYGGFYDPYGCVTWDSQYLYAFVNGNWTYLNAHGVKSSLAAYRVSMAYDSRDHYVLEFGGEICKPASCPAGATTWNYTHGRWTELNPSRSPSWRISDSLLFDQKLGPIIMFGGEAAGSSSKAMNTTWDLIGGSWTLLHPAQSPPAGGATPASAHDAADGYILLFGGQYNPSVPWNDAWIYR